MYFLAVMDFVALCFAAMGVSVLCCSFSVLLIFNWAVGRSSSLGILLFSFDFQLMESLPRRVWVLLLRFCFLVAEF